MDIFDFVYEKNKSIEKSPNKLSSHRHAAELICSAWNSLDVRIIEPFLDENIEVDDYTAGKHIQGKASFLKLLQGVFDSLQYSKNSYKADIILPNGQYSARITMDDSNDDQVYQLEIVDGLIKKIRISHSGDWWFKALGGKSPFGVIHQTSLHELAVSVAVIEQYVKTEIGDKTIKWATPYELKNSHCQLSFTLDGLSYDVLIEIHTFDDEECRFVMWTEYTCLINGCKDNGHIPCILALNENREFVSLTLLEDMDVRVKKIRSQGMNEWTFRQLFRTKAQLSKLVITKNNRILLPDYDLEVKMEPLVKAVFFLFLKHPEGIAFKQLSDYQEELVDIYKRLRPLGITDRARQSIADLTNPLLNSINEKSARVRSAFVKLFDDHLAKNYYISGERGEKKTIKLPRDLVVWE